MPLLGNFGSFSFLRSWKLTCFLTTCLSAYLSILKFQVSVSIIYMVKIMWRGFTKILSSRSRDTQKRSKFRIRMHLDRWWNFHQDWFIATPWSVKTNLNLRIDKYARRQVVRKQVSFQDRKKENTLNFLALRYDIKE